LLLIFLKSINYARSRRISFSAPQRGLVLASHAAHSTILPSISEQIDFIPQSLGRENSKKKISAQFRIATGDAVLINEKFCTSHNIMLKIILFSKKLSEFYSSQ
jgi:hypothetical protein